MITKFLYLFLPLSPRRPPPSSPITRINQLRQEEDGQLWPGTTVRVYVSIMEEWSGQVGDSATLNCCSCLQNFFLFYAFSLVCHIGLDFFKHYKYIYNVFVIVRNIF